MNAGVDVAQVGVGNVMIFVARLNAAVPRSKYLHAPRNLGGEIELSGAEHTPVEVQKSPAARQKWLDPVMVKEIDLCADGTAASSVSIPPLAIRLRISHHRKWDHFGPRAQLSAALERALPIMMVRSQKWT